MNPARYAIETPRGRAGAIGLVSLTGDVDLALARAGLGPVAPRQVALRVLPGIDSVVVARWTAAHAHVMPHGGPLIMRLVAKRFESLGIAPAVHAPSQPERDEEISDSFLDETLGETLALAASPLAIDILLDHTRRWRGPDVLPLDEAASAPLRRLIVPPLIVAWGPPNIGKSSLLLQALFSWWLLRRQLHRKLALFEQRG